jgi:DNA gyrase subunit A
MVQQFNRAGAEARIVPTALHSEMQQSYLEYAMSVIVGRALPDVRDGLKPVHRRILYAMHELGLTPDRPFRKCARVVGDVLGKYHPHGDQSVYDALVRLVQDFSSRYPLVAGHGNFGSIDNDPPAAMRYTETRLSPVGYEAVLGEISSATVDFIGNFDNSQQEPTVLPAQFPVLLVNGCSGIAVGMATNVPPHNFGEIVDGLIALIDNPQLPDHQLWTIIPGPDFPTGGEILGNDGICEAYRTGKGIISLRGVVHIEEASKQAKPGKSRKRRDSLIISELPYQVNKAAWIEKIAELVNNQKIVGIADLRDESDRDGMRVVIELKRDADYQQVIDSLYKQTALQNSFGAIFLALVDGLPRQLTLRQMLQEFLKFREETLTRQYSSDLEHCEQRAHILAGLLTALENLDGTIDILRNAPDGTTAKMQMLERFGLSEEQADAILAMPMRRLTGMERQNLAKEAEEQATKIASFQKLLQDRKELLKSMKKDLRGLRKKFADPRRTKIVDAKPILPQVAPPPPPPRPPVAPLMSEPLPSSLVPLDATGALKEELTAEFRESWSAPELIDATAVTTTAAVVLDVPFPAADEPLVLSPPPTTTPKAVRPPRSQQISLLSIEPVPPQLVEVEFTKNGYIRAITRPENRLDRAAGDVVISRQSVMNDQELVVISSGGKAYPLKVQNIPTAFNHSETGTLALSLIPGLAASNEQVLYLSEPAQSLSALILLSAQGRVKRLLIEELAGLTTRGSALIKLREDDYLVFVTPLQEAKELIIGTSIGRLLRLAINADQLPVQGRPSQGVQGLRVGSKEQLVACVPVKMSDNLLLITSQGYGKQLPVSALRLVPTGNIGNQAMQFSSREDHLMGIIMVQADRELVVMTNQQRSLVVAIDQIPIMGKEGMGEKVLDLAPAEESIALQLQPVTTAETLPF